MNKVISAESRFQKRQSTTHKLMQKIGRLGSEVELPDADAAHVGKKRVGRVAALAAGTGMVLGGKAVLNDQFNSSNFQHRVAICAGELEGHKVVINYDENGSPIVKKADLEAVKDCRTARGDITYAKKLYDEHLGQAPGIQPERPDNPVDVVNNAE